MRMSIEEKKVLYAFGCPDHINTVSRLEHLAALTVDPDTKKLIARLALKLLSEGVDKWYRCFFYNLRLEMEEYYNALCTMHMAEVSTIGAEDFDNEADEV